MTSLASLRAHITVIFHGCRGRRHLCSLPAREWAHENRGQQRERGRKPMRVTGHPASHPPPPPKQDSQPCLLRPLRATTDTAMAHLLEAVIFVTAQRDRCHKYKQQGDEYLIVEVTMQAPVWTFLGERTCARVSILSSLPQGFSPPESRPSGRFAQVMPGPRLVSPDNLRYRL